MHKVSVFWFGSLITCITVLVGFSNVAFGQGACGVTIIKEASGGGNTLFEYEVTVDGDPSFLVKLPGGEITGGPFNSTVTVSELPISGWTLTDISCENAGATGFEITENGFTASCDGGGEVTCTFVNERLESSIPTLSEWGMIAMAGALAAIGLYISARRRRVTA